ncbi:hypothetical protein LTR05_002266 [Lithohypha guttulata]|uniref:EF-hand domain-containing protein n=1 Tax=Lithohypha guttulata TaxID=1690604 RepID=A0AAN7YC28_9EURO|nr:hypothetical protein LTR05_002266 [Lithohypha guttulata]
MAYNKTFNPDALPAHAEPDQAAQALGHFSIKPQQQQPQQQQQHKPLPRPTHHANPPPRLGSPGGRRPSPAAYAAQQAFRPHNLQTQHNHNHGYSQHPDQRYLQSPPPPADYGQGLRPRPPPAGYGALPSQQVQVPQRTMPPPDADSADLYPLFRAANASGTGSLTVSELGSALVNADFTPFDPLTIRSLMKMFSTTPLDHPHGPVVVFSEFQSLWKFLAAWRQLFERFDADGSGKISLAEFTNALVAFGYRLSQPFIEILYATFNNRASDRRDSSRYGMSFDLFVQACIRLKRMTDVFKSYDDDRDGYVTLSFEEFLSEILKLQQE